MVRSLAELLIEKEATLGQSFEDAGGELMTIVNDSRVFATANIYEKDLAKIKTGQKVSLKLAACLTVALTAELP